MYRFMKTTFVLRSAIIIAAAVAPIVGLVTSSRDTNSPASIAVFQSTGRELFLNNCARCHGDDAKGDKGPDLTSTKRQSKWSASEEPLIAKINKGGLFMPKFGKQLSPEEIKQIADYVRSLRK